MKALNATTVGTIAAGLGLALVITAAPLFAQPQGLRGQHGGEGPADAPPAWRMGHNFERGPGPGGPAPGGPMAHGPMLGGPGILADHFARFWDRPAIVDLLELSENQVELLQQSYDQTKPILEANGKAMREAGRTIGDSLRGTDDPDLNAINKAIDELTTAQNAMMKAVAAHRATVQSLLLDEQLEELQKVRQRQMRAVAPQLRERAEQMRQIVRRVAADGVFSDAERTRVEAHLKDAPEVMRERVLAAIEQAVSRVAEGAEPGDLKEELSTIPEAPRPPRVDAPLPPKPPRARDGSGPGDGPRARR